MVMDQQHDFNSLIDYKDNFRKGVWILKFACWHEIPLLARSYTP